MAILYQIKFEFLGGHILFPPNLGPGTRYYEKVNEAIDKYTPLECIASFVGAEVTGSYSYIFPDEHALNTFYNILTMTESEKLSMKEWLELNKIKITYHLYDISESTVPAPAPFG
jgi:hypothetical protein